MNDEQLLRCPSCREPMRRLEELKHADGQLFLDLYQCSDVARCGRKAGLQWELTGKGMTKEGRSWVEREIQARGSFFPGDYTGSSGPGRGAR